MVRLSWGVFLDKNEARSGYEKDMLCDMMYRKLFTIYVRIESVL